MASKQRTNAFRSQAGGAGVSKKAFAATPFQMDVGSPYQGPEDDAAAALNPVSMSEMVPLNLGALNGAPADQNDDSFYKNLADEIEGSNKTKLDGFINTLMQAVERDVETYSELDEVQARGIEEMGFDRSNDKRTEPFPGASAAIHPMLAQAVTELVSRAMKELMPPGGPARSKLYGKQTPVRQGKSTRATTYINWQLTEQCPEYRTEFEKMLTITAFTGDGTRKLYWDDDYNRPRSEFINSDQFIVPYGISDLETAPRYTHLMYLFEDQVEGYISGDLWRDVNLPKPTNASRSKTKEKSDKVTSQKPSSDDADAQYEIMEIHADAYFEGLGPDQMGDNKTEEPEARLQQKPEMTVEDAPESMVTLSALSGDGTAAEPESEAADTQTTTGTTDAGSGARKKKPFIITVERQSKKVLAIRRNWKQSDKKCRKRVWFMHYYLFPWTGWRGIGLWHMIGGLQKAATGSLRALLDAAILKSMPGGIRLKGSRTSGNEIRFRPLDYVEVDAPGATDIREVAMPLPFDGPSPVLFDLLGFLVQSGSMFASVATKPVAEMNPNAPVGTTLALIEEGGRVYNAIHARLHYSQKKELALLCELNYEHLDDKVTVEAFGNELVVSKEDFANDVGIVPVSDPEVSNQIQKMARSDTMLGLMERAKAQGVNANMQLGYKNAARVVGNEDVDELFPDPQQAQPLDPVSELQALIKNQPVDAFPGQNHVAHVAFLRAISQNPQYQMMIQNIAPQFVALGHAHLVMAIKDEIEKRMGGKIPELPPGQEMSPQQQQQMQQLQSRVADAVADAAQKLPTMDIFGTDPSGGQGHEQQLALILGKAAMEEIAAKREQTRITTEADLQKTAAQLAADKERFMMEMMVKLTLEYAKLDSAEERDAAKLAATVAQSTGQMMERVIRLMHDMNKDHRGLDIQELAAKNKPTRQAAE